MIVENQITRVIDRSLIDSMADFLEKEVGLEFVSKRKITKKELDSDIYKLSVFIERGIKNEAEDLLCRKVFQKLMDMRLNVC